MDSNDFVIKNISLPAGVTDYTLYFGLSRDSSRGVFSHDDFNVYVSDDGNRWSELSYEFPKGDPETSTWDLASATFSLPAQTSCLYIYFTTNVAAGYCIDDVCLMASDTYGVSVNFSTGVELPGYTGYEGDGTMENPYKVSQAVDLVNSGSYDPDTIYFVKGVVTSDKGGSSSRISYYISESGYFQNEPELYIFGGLYLGGENFPGFDSLNNLDEVVVYGNFSMSDDGTPEMAEGKLYSLNETVADLGTEGDGTKDNPYTTTDALKIIKTGLLGTYTFPDNVYYVKGIVSEIVKREIVVDSVFYVMYIEYNISDDGSDNDELCISKGYSFCHTSWFTNNLYAGDEVVVYGNLSNAGMGTGDLYYQNGEKEDEDNVCYYMNSSSFIRYCLYNFDINGNGKVSFAEAEEVTAISCSTNGGHIDFAGIEYFPNLESFESTSAKYLDVSRNTELSYIRLSGGINMSSSKIEALDLSYNKKLLSLDATSFWNCENLEYIAFPETLTSIGEHAFERCTSLKSVSFPEGLKEIGYSAFYGCTSLESVSFPEGLKTIGTSAFERCTSLETLSFPENLSSIGGSAFYGCTSLESVSFPEGLKEIESYAFERCTSLETLSFPENLSSIGGSAFYGCTSLESVSFPEGLEKIADDAFRSCTSLETLSFPENLSSIGLCAFYGCTSLESVSFPEGLKEIGRSVFNGCTSLKSVTFPENLQSLEDSAFYGCTSLEFVSFPEGLEMIGNYAFENCSNLKSASIKATTPPSLRGACFANIDSSAVLYVPSGCQSAYKNSTWSKYFQISTL